MNKNRILTKSSHDNSTPTSSCSYELLQRVGSGAQGVVWKSKTLSSSSNHRESTVAIKIIDIAPLNEKQRELALNEVRVLSMMSNNNNNNNFSLSSSSSPSSSVMRYLDSFLTEYDELCLVLEWAEGGTLQDWLDKRKTAKEEIASAAKNNNNNKTSTTTNTKNNNNIGSSSSSSALSPLLARFIWHILISVSTALDHCHQQKVIHRDIKPANIFFSDNAPPLFFNDEEFFHHNHHQQEKLHQQQFTGRFPKCLLGDFGVLDHKTSASTFLGTPYFVSPSVCKGEKYDYKTDIWGLGVCGYLCVNNNRYPYEAANYAALILKIVQHQPAEHDANVFNNTNTNSNSTLIVSNNGRLKSPTYQLRDFVDSCLKKSTQARPSASDLLTKRFTILMANQLGLMNLYREPTRKIAAKVLGDAHIEKLKEITAARNTNDQDGEHTQVSVIRSSPLKNGGKSVKTIRPSSHQDDDTNTTVTFLHQYKLPPATSAPATGYSSLSNREKEKDITTATAATSSNSSPQQNLARPSTTTSVFVSSAGASRQMKPRINNSNNTTGVMKTRRTMQQDRINNRAHGAIGNVSVINISAGTPNSHNNKQRLRQRNSYVAIHEQHQKESSSTSSSSKIKSTKADRQSVRDLPDEEFFESGKRTNRDQNEKAEAGLWKDPLSLPTAEFAQHSNMTTQTTQQNDCYRASSQLQGQEVDVDDVSDEEHREIFLGEEDCEEEGEEELEPFGSTKANVSWKIRDQDGEIVDDDDDEFEYCENQNPHYNDVVTPSSSLATTTTTTTSTTEHYEDVKSLETQIELCQSEGRALVGEECFAKLIDVVKSAKNAEEIEGSVRDLKMKKSEVAVNEAVHCAYRLSLLNAVLIAAAAK